MQCIARNGGLRNLTYETVGEMIEAPPKTLPAELGFRSGVCGTHTRRTMMLSELASLLEVSSPTASLKDYRTAIVEQNVLSKKTASNRSYTAQYLGKLYCLDDRMSLFRKLRFFWELDEEGRPLLACLCANARDPLHRITAPHVLATRIGETVASVELDELVEAFAPGHFSATTRKGIAQRTLSSWTQSGHLEGRRVRKRRHPVVTPANTAYALLLGYLAGFRGPMLFNTFWTGLLDASTEELHAMTAEASRREWLDYRRMGTVVEVSFTGLLTQREKEAVNG